MIKTKSDLDNYTPAHRVSSAIGAIKKILLQHEKLKKEEIVNGLRSILGTLEPKENPKLLESRLIEGWEAIPDFLLVNTKKELDGIRKHLANAMEGKLSEDDFKQFFAANFALKKQNIKPLKNPLIIECNAETLYEVMYNFYYVYCFHFKNIRGITVKIFRKSFLKLQNQKYKTAYSNMQKTSGRTIKDKRNAQSTIKNPQA